MCRIIFGIGNINIDTIINDFIIIANNQNEKHEHNRNVEFKHGDGWGVVYKDSNDRLDIKKSMNAVYEDENIQKYRTLDTSILLLHARRGSRGQRILANVHPFRQDKYIFCHNGTVKETISYDSRYVPEGETDSEQFFYYLLTNLKGNFSIDGLGEQLGKINSYSGMNTFTMRDNVAYVTNWHAYNPNYYTMKLLRTKNFLIISSEVLPSFKDYNWERLENRTVLRVDMEAGGIEGKSF